jgi:hypothetical protein
MFAKTSSKDRTARSFGGLRMTEKVGGLSSYVCKRPPNLIVILRPPKDLAVLPSEKRCANIE